MPDNITDNHVDDHIDNTIAECLDLTNPKSFFLFAGAGSGKTRSLVMALEHIKKSSLPNLIAHSRSVAVITYTNAACDEIKSRIGYDSAFHVSTIHSFVWELIKNHQRDIKKWIIHELNTSISELNEKIQNGRSGKALENNKANLAKKESRLQKINTVKRFSYNPNGENTSYDSLQHSEVLKIGAQFLTEFSMLQKILITKYPILLIDECQDTNKLLIDAFFEIGKSNPNDFCIGLFGDTAQKIYLDGKDKLDESIPDTWLTPSKVMNHRSGNRIVELINKIRENIDGKTQKARQDASIGVIRLFIVPDNMDKGQVEDAVCKAMAEITGSDGWLQSYERKKLILEHHMAATRLGFSSFFEKMYVIDSFKQGLLDGSLPEVRLFTKIICPLMLAAQENNQFKIAKIVKNNSPLMSKETIKCNTDQLAALHKAQAAVVQLLAVFTDNANPTCYAILKEVYASGLFPVPAQLYKILLSQNYEDFSEDEHSLYEAMQCPFNEVIRYDKYIEGETEFATHQGVKGLEFSNVMVILDDAKARGFLFSYEKLFGAKSLSKTDVENISMGKDSAMDRTQRLFYVTCSRAMNSLAIVSYTSGCQIVRDTAINNGWFSEEEIVVMNSL